MKTVLLILSVLFPLLSGGGKPACSGLPESSGVVTASDSSGAAAPAVPCRDICITASQGTSFSGSENESTVSLQTLTPGRRIHQGTKTPSRHIKAGKLIDTHNYASFLSALFLGVDGEQSLQRYIYSICCLRL